MTRTQLNIGIAICLVALAAAFRILPHPDNFAPMAAVAIFGGALLPRRVGVLVPLMAMVLTDLIIDMHDLVLVTWGSYALIALASSLVLKKSSFGKILAMTLGGSVFFFVTTNFAVWLMSGMYTRTLAGLQQCFVLALPFFRGTLMGDLFYTAALFGLYALAVQASDKVIGVSGQPVSQP